MKAKEKTSKEDMIWDLRHSYAYECPDNLVDWWWETYYRGMRWPYRWSAEIARETMVKA